MSKYIGLDWASKGWFGIILYDNGDWESRLFSSIWSVWKQHSDASRVLIDIPIGLPTVEKRACDVQAKSKLESRQSSVFYTPIREAIAKDNIIDAKEVNERNADFSIQNQAWSIMPRIREVDEFLDMCSDARGWLEETHPEMCFYGLKQPEPVEYSKKIERGIEERISLLSNERPDAGEIFTTCVDQYTLPSYAPMVGGKDDIIDALAAAITAQRSSENCSTLPESRQTDEQNLPMQIVYPKPEQLS